MVRGTTNVRNCSTLHVMVCYCVSNTGRSVAPVGRCNLHTLDGKFVGSSPSVGGKSVACLTRSKRLFVFIQIYST